MTSEELLYTAMRQSAEDIGCSPDDFLSDRNIVIPIRRGRNARRYLEDPIPAAFVSYGSNVVAAASEDILDTVREYTARFTFYHLFETPNLHWLDNRLAPDGYAVCFMAEYFLPVTAQLPVPPCSFPMRVLGPSDFEGLYVPEWSNALCRDRRHLDVLGVGAFDGENLIGLAACSADCDSMWQIGVDVLPAWRRNGIAAALTAKLAREILERGRVPFYCCAWSNIRSVRTALRSGFRPAWAEMTVKPVAVVQKMNEKQEGRLNASGV